MEQKLYTLEELVEQTGENPETIKTKRKRGKLEYIKVPREAGGREVIKYTQAALDLLLGERSANNYETLRDEWVQAQRYGTHTGKPLKERTIQLGLCFLRGYWSRLKMEPSIQGLSPANFEKLMLTIPIREKEKVDHYGVRVKTFDAVTSFYKHLIKRGFKSELELLALRKLRPKRSFPERRTVLKKGELKKLLDANESLKGRTEFDRAHTKTLLFLYTFAGLRRNEALTLECDWVNLETGEMRVLGKGGKWRDVKAGAELLAQMREWYYHWRPKSKHPQFILQKGGNPQTVNAVQDRIQNLRAKAGNLNITIHGFRRTFATFAAASGLAPSKLQRVMGHEHLSTTERYLLTDGKAAAHDMAQIDFFTETIGPETQEKPEPKKANKKAYRDEWD